MEVLIMGVLIMGVLIMEVIFMGGGGGGFKIRKWLSLWYVTVICHCDMSLWYVTVICHCDMSLWYVTVICHCDMSLWYVTVIWTRFFLSVVSCWFHLFKSRVQKMRKKSQCFLKCNHKFEHKMKWKYSAVVIWKNEVPGSSRIWLMSN